MKIQPFYRTILISAATLTLCLIVGALLMTTHSAGATLTAASTSPQSPSAVTRITLPGSTAAYNGIITSSTRLYAPWMLGGTSSLHVYNTNQSTTTTVRYTFAYSDGISAELVLEAGAVGRIQATAVLTGARFSAILTATHPIVAVVNDFGPSGKHATSYAAMPADLGQSCLALPDILYETGGGWNSNPVIQNVGVTTTSVTIVYTETPDTPTTNHWVDNSITDLAPGATYFIDPNQAGLPANFLGIATVKADQPLLSVVYNAAFELGAVFPSQAYAYRVPLPRVGDGASRSLYYPLLVNAFEDWKTSEIQMMNAGPTNITFTLKISQTTYDKSVDSWFAYSMLQNQPGSSSPPGKEAAGRIEDAQTLESLVWLNGQGRFVGDFLAAYSTPSVGGKTWYLPYTDQGLSFSTYVAVQNLSDTTANIILTHHTITGTLSSYSGVIPGSSMTLYTGGSGLPSDFTGGIVIKADQPVVAVAIIAGRLVLDKEILLPIITKGN